MRKILKKGIFGALSILMIISITAYAKSNETSNDLLNQAVVQPYFTNISIFQNVFDIDSKGKASISVYLTARDVDNVKVDAYLQQYKNGNWTTIQSWTNTSVGTNSGLGGTYYVTKGYGYRLFSIGNVYKSGVRVENTTFTSETKNY